MMKESYQLVTSFITPYGSYCYVTMPFGLKNAGATYQRCMQQCFTDQIEPLDQPDQVERRKPTIAIYVFGVPMGKLLGYIMSERGIEANLKKIMAIFNMGPIHNVKGV